MISRPLGRCGFEVSAIGFGAWGLGGTSGGSVAYGPVDDRVSLAALARAWELGVSFVDTSDLYGMGHSEAVVGRSLAGTGKRVRVATKAGFLDAGGKQDFSPARLRRAIEASLKRLGLARVDLFQLHSPPLELWKRERTAILEAIRALKGEGKIGAFGISVARTEDGLAFAEEEAVEALQVNLNLLDQRALSCGLVEKCRLSGIGVIARTPLNFGFLSDAFEGEAPAFGAGDHRSRWSREQVERWLSARAHFLPLKERIPGQTLSQLALRFAFSPPGVSTVIPGILTPKEAEENAAAAELGPLSADELAWAAEIFRTHEFFVSKK